jgi:hypothetical protein
MHRGRWPVAKHNVRVARSPFAYHYSPRHLLRFRRLQLLLTNHHRFRLKSLRPASHRCPRLLRRRCIARHQCRLQRSQATNHLPFRAQRPIPMRYHPPPVQYHLPTNHHQFRLQRKLSSKRGPTLPQPPLASSRHRLRRRRVRMYQPLQLEVRSPRTRPTQRLRCWLQVIPHSGHG